MHVGARGQGIVISVTLDEPLPRSQEGKAGFNLEFLPSAQFGKASMIHGRSGYSDALAGECLEISRRVWDDEQSHPPDLFRHGNTTGGPLDDEKLKAAVELVGERMLTPLR